MLGKCKIKDVILILKIYCKIGNFFEVKKIIIYEDFIFLSFFLNDFLK